MSCKHEAMYWYPAPHNETGWKCADCDFKPGEPPGYSPQHDRDLIRDKCWCLLHDLVDAELVSVSNSDHGESLASRAASIARYERRFDQESIVAILTRLCAGDGSFWRDQHEKILAGQDPRERCACGQLANCYCNGKRACCHEHLQIALGRDPKEPW